MAVGRLEPAWVGQAGNQFPAESDAEPGAMIHWLVQPAAALPEDAEALLSAAEAAAFATFTVPKRRADWLLGRVTAKQLVQSYLNNTHGAAPTLDRISIAADADGAPYGMLDGARLPPSLSISHSHATALCALSDEPGVNVGADIEFVEARDPAFLRDFFTEREQAWAAASAEPDVATTLLWSAKEAVLKALREGLRIDTKQLEITVPPFAAPPAEWAEIAVTLTPELAARFPGTWSTWWRGRPGFVLTLAQRTHT